MSKSIFSIFTSNARVFEASKRNLTINFDCTINLNSSRLELLADSHSTIDVLSEDGCGESKLCVVGSGNSLFFGLEGVNNNHGSEYFFFFDRSIGLRVGEDGGLNEQTLESDSI